MESKILFPSLTRVLQWYAKLWPKPYPKPPYDHVCQVGDPVLRHKAEPVDVKAVSSEQIQTIIQKMINVLRKNDLVGLAAPQIGSPYQIFIAELRAAEMKKHSPEMIKAKEIEEFPLQVFINPTITVINNHKLKFREQCECLKGYSAVVPRSYEIKVKAYDATGNEFVWQKKGWTARIIQHEMDHLNGQLYIDIMESTTYQFDLWQNINHKRGRMPWILVGTQK